MTQHPSDALTEDQIKDKLESIEDVLRQTTDKFEIAVLQLLQKCEQFINDPDGSEFEDDGNTYKDDDGDDFKDPLQRKKQRRRLHSSASILSSSSAVSGPTARGDLIDEHETDDFEEDDDASLTDVYASDDEKDTEEQEEDEEGDGGRHTGLNGDNGDNGERKAQGRGRSRFHRPHECLDRAFETPVWSVVEDSLFADPYLRAAHVALRGRGGSGEGIGGSSRKPNNDDSSAFLDSSSSEAPALERDSLGRLEFNILWEDFQKWFAWHGASVANTFTVSRSNYHYKRGSRAGQVRMHYSCCLNNKRQKKHRSAASAGKITQFFQQDATTVAAARAEGSSSGGNAAGKKRKQSGKITSFFQPAPLVGGEASASTSTQEDGEERPCKAGFTATKMVGVKRDGGEVEYCHIVYAYRHNHPLDHQPVPGLPFKLQGVKERIKPKLERGGRLDRVLRRLMVEDTRFAPPHPTRKQKMPSSSSPALAARDDVLTLGDIFDLWYNMTIKEELSKAGPSEAEACQQWMNDLQKDGSYITMSVKTAQGNLYGWTSKWQLEMIRKHGGVISLVGNDELLGPKAYMYTLSVMHHECRLGVPVAFLICPARTQEHLEKWMRFVLAAMQKHLRLEYVPQGVVTYLGAPEIAALQQVFKDSIIFPGALFGFEKWDRKLDRLLGGEYSATKSKLLSDLKYTLRQGYYGDHYVRSMREKAQKYEGLVEHLDEYYLGDRYRQVWCDFLNTFPHYSPAPTLRFHTSLLGMLNIYPLRLDVAAAAVPVPTTLAASSVSSEQIRRTDHVIGVLTQLVLPNYRVSLDPAVWPHRLGCIYRMSDDYTDEDLEVYYTKPRKVDVPILSNRVTPEEWVFPAARRKDVDYDDDGNEYDNSYENDYDNDDSGGEGGGQYSDSDEQRSFNSFPYDDEDDKDNGADMTGSSPPKAMWAKGGPLSVQKRKAWEALKKQEEDKIQTMLDQWFDVYETRIPGAKIDYEDEILMMLKAGFNLMRRAIAKQKRV